MVASRRVRRALPICLLALVLASMGGCNTFYPPMPPSGSEELRRTPKVITQYCFPTSDVRGPYIGVGVVRRWGYADYQRSYGGDHGHLEGRTVADQPVFEHASYQRPIDLLATTVPVPAKGVEYVYRPPTNLSAQTWTPWLPPSAAAHQAANVMWRILYDRTYEAQPIPADAPKIRYRLRSYNDEQEAKRAWPPVQERIPACS